MTFGAYYKNDDWDMEDENSEEYLYDETSPSFRLHVVTEQGQFDDIFSDSQQVDFENKMILVYMFIATTTNRPQKIKRIRLGDKTLFLIYCSV